MAPTVFLPRESQQAVCLSLEQETRAQPFKFADRRFENLNQVNDWVMQFLADQLAMPVERPVVTETTALGAAYLAGLGAGVFASPEDIARQWKRQREFKPAMKTAERNQLYAGWQAAVARVRSG